MTLSPTRLAGRFSRTRIASIASAAAILLGPAALAQNTPAAKPAKRSIYPQADDARARLDAALAEAKATNTRVLVQWGDDWCGWCLKLHDLCGQDRAIARELLYEYEVVLVPVGRFDRNLDLANSLGADFKSSGVPFLTVLDADGNSLAQQETGSLEDGPNHDPAKVLAFLKSHEAAPRSAISVRDAALEQAKQSDRVVMLDFSAPWCGWCRRLAAWSKQPEVHAILTRHFVEATIDIDRDAGGKELMGKYRRDDSGGIPWFAFVAVNGSVLATADGPEGNVGFPSSDDEIAHFRAALTKAAPAISASELDTLTASLVADRTAREEAAKAARAAREKQATESPSSSR